MLRGKVSEKLLKPAGKPLANMHGKQIYITTKSTTQIHLFYRVVGRKEPP